MKVEDRTKGVPEKARINRQLLLEGKGMTSHLMVLTPL